MIVAAMIVGLTLVACITVRVPDALQPTPLPEPTPLPSPAMLPEPSAVPHPRATVSPLPPDDATEEWLTWGAGAVAVGYGALRLWLRRRAKRAAVNALAREPPG